MALLDVLESLCPWITGRDAATLALKYDPLGQLRSSAWPAVRREHLKREPCCQVCGTREDVEAHHVEPVQIAPTKELEAGNLLSLCRPHHLLVGHLMRWASWNPQVREDAADWRLKIRLRPELWPCS